MRRVLGIVLAIVVIGFVAIQLVPYGREHTNPPVTGEPAWDTARTQALFMQTCGDCHSNETAWPWYTNIAPVSWRIQAHVDDGREAFNVSEWGTGEQEADEAAEQVLDGDMPPFDYLLVHPAANLSAADEQALVDGLAATFGDEAGIDGPGDGEASGDGGYGGADDD
jgi:mono/diheme cytochrome c family protein